MKTPTINEQNLNVVLASNVPQNGTSGISSNPEQTDIFSLNCKYK